jgi:hypothetical protein
MHVYQTMRAELLLPIEKREGFLPLALHHEKHTYRNPSTKPRTLYISTLNTPTNPSRTARLTTQTTLRLLAQQETMAAPRCCHGLSRSPNEASRYPGPRLRPLDSSVRLVPGLGACRRPSIPMTSVTGGTRETLPRYPLQGKGFRPPFWIIPGWFGSSALHARSKRALSRVCNRGSSCRVQPPS